MWLQGLRLLLGRGYRNRQYVLKRYAGKGCPLIRVMRGQFNDDIITIWRCHFFNVSLARFCSCHLCFSSRRGRKSDILIFSGACAGVVIVHRCHRWVGLGDRCAERIDSERGRRDVLRVQRRRVEMVIERERIKGVALLKIVLTMLALGVWILVRGPMLAQRKTAHQGGS